MKIALLIAMSFALAAQTPDAKTAGQAYKNVTELKDIPADQLGPAMQFIAVSLGMTCESCHVAGKFESDDKRAKKTAREMIAMTMAINKNSFRGQTQVTCFSCHRGSERPVSIPPVQDSDAMPKAEARPAQTTPPSADSVLEKYVAAMGGADAMKKITSRVETGVIMVAGKDTPVEVLTKAPNKRVTITHSPGGDSFTAFDGTIGWMGNAGRPAREMSPTENLASGLDAEFYLGLRMKEIFTQLRAGRPDKIGDVDVLTLTGTRQGQPPVRFSFDAKTGLLMREVRYSENPMGRMPTQIDYADYREVDGVKIPFRWTLARPNGRFTIQIHEAKSNAAIDDSKFAKP
jgi:outer membrane lipoprotein-sorting protein